MTRRILSVGLENENRRTSGGPGGTWIFLSRASPLVRVRCLSAVLVLLLVLMPLDAELDQAINEF